MPTLLAGRLGLLVVTDPGTNSHAKAFSVNFFLVAEASSGASEASLDSGWE